MYLINSFYFLVIVCFTIVLWRRRKYYYLSYKLPGPFAFPIIGNLLMLLNANRDYTYDMDVTFRYPDRFRLWFGPRLVILDSAPEDLEIILNKCLNKGFLYGPLKFYFGDGLLTAPVEKWKKNRKFINRSFNPKLIENFFTIFLERSSDFAAEIETWPTETQIDVQPKIFDFTFKTAIASLCDLDPSLITDVNTYSNHLSNFEHAFIEYFHNPLSAIPLLIKKKALSEKLSQLTTVLYFYLQNLLNIKVSKMDNFDESSSKSKTFLNQLITLNRQSILSDQDLLDEFSTMMMAGSDTLGHSVGLVLLVLGIYPEYQNKVLDELDQIFGQTDRKTTLQDIKKMNYLEQVVKEVLRLFSLVPAISRETTCETTLADGTILPPNTIIGIPIFKVHKNPKIWKDPLKFDPDRFLPEEFKKLPKNAYIPFSLGPRNCIGHAYGMLLMKTLISEVIKKYRIISDKYKSTDEIEFSFHLLMKPCKGLPMRFEKRN